MLAGDEEREWACLVRRTRRTALIPGRVEIVERSDHISVRSRRRRHRLPAALLTVAAGCALWQCARALAHDGPTGGALVFGLAAVVAAALAATVMLARAGVSWHLCGNTLTLWSGIWPFVWRAELPRRELRAQITVKPQRSQPREERSGVTVLSLRHERWPGPVRLACLSESNELRQALDKLDTFLDGAVQDELLHTVTFPEGREIVVDTAAIRPGRYSLSYGRLELPADDLAMYVCSPSHAIIPVLLSAAPLALALGVAFYSGPGRIGVLTALAVLGVGAALIASQLSRSSVIFDLNEGVVSFHGRFPEPKPGIEISDVAAIQVCCWYKAGEFSGLLYEVNLVLWDPPGSRVNLLTTPADRSAVQEARRLADHIRVPFLDQTR